MMDRVMQYCNNNNNINYYKAQRCFINALIFEECRNYQQSIMELANLKDFLPEKEYPQRYLTHIVRRGSYVQTLPDKDKRLYVYDSYKQEYLLFLLGCDNKKATRYIEAFLK